MAHKNRSKVGKSIPKIRKSQMPGSPFLDKPEPSTRNPLKQQGTYLTPDNPLSQRDRFKLANYDSEVQRAARLKIILESQIEFLLAQSTPEQRARYDAFVAEETKSYIESEDAKKQKTVSWEDKKATRQALKAATEKLKERRKPIIDEDDDSVPWIVE